VLAGTVFIFSGVELTPSQVAVMRSAGTYAAYMQQETMRVVAPYLVLGLIAFGWAALIARTRFPAIRSEHEGAAGDHGSFRQLLRYPHFLLAVVAQFMYVGAQVGTWSYFIQYVQVATRQPEKVAGYFLTGTLAAFGIGRFASAALMKYVRPARLMGVYGVVNIALLVLGVLYPSWIGLWAIFLTSFFMSVMYPTIFALGIEGLGPNTKIAGSLIVMGIVGGGVLTPVMGWIAQTSGSIALAYVVPLLGYVIVALYAFFWASLEPTQTAPIQA
jgi:FHS family L-fucose permease-like MFS transporter